MIARFIAAARRKFILFFLVGIPLLALYDALTGKV